MILLVINAGSSSIKYQLFDMDDESVMAKGRIERIGSETAIIVHESDGKPEYNHVAEILDHAAAIRQVTSLLVHKQHGSLEDIRAIGGVGHRVVHGGESFSQSMRVDQSVMKEIIRLYDLAPLHNPAHMLGIQAVELNLPGIPQIVVFDSAFHQTMPRKAFLYPIPMVLYRKHKVRRYGFHGTSHQYVSQQAARFLNEPLEQLKMVTCHIGNGVSCTAILNGQSVDTSMGMTPLEGVMMGTRSGDIDPAIVPYIMNKEELTTSEVNSMLNKHSGLQAVSDGMSDMREIVAAMEDGDRSAELAFDMYEYRIRKYIGAYAAAMNGMDVLVFTAGVGENARLLRQRICCQLSFFGVELDETLNNSADRGMRTITTASSRVKVLVVPTNEELVIARDTYRILLESSQADN